MLLRPPCIKIVKRITDPGISSIIFSHILHRIFCYDDPDIRFLPGFFFHQVLKTRYIPVLSLAVNAISIDILLHSVFFDRHFFSIKMKCIIIPLRKIF